MEKKNLLYLFLLVLLGILLRSLIADNVDNAIYEATFKPFPNSFSLENIISNNFSPLSWLTSLPFIDLNLAYNRFFNFNLLNDIFGIFSIISIYFLGKNFGGKNSVLVGLLSSLLCATSAILIYLGNGTNPLNASFFVATLILLMDSYIVLVKENSKFKYLHILSLILFLIHPISIIFITCNYLLLGANTKNKFSKIFTKKIVHIIMAIPICAIIIMAFGEKINFMQFIAPYFSLFSAVKPNEILNLFSNPKTIFDFIFYTLAPAGISLFFVVKAGLLKRKETNYLVEMVSFVYPIVYILTSNLNTCSKVNLLIEIYPIFIILMALGFSTLKNKNLKFILLGVFLGIQVFLLIANIFGNF